MDPGLEIRKASGGWSCFGIAIDLYAPCFDLGAKPHIIRIVAQYYN